MAKKIIGFELKVSGSEKIVSQVANIANELDKVTLEMKQLDKAAKAALGAGNIEEAKKYNAQIAALKDQQAGLKVEQRAANKELNLQAAAFKAVGAASGSYDAIDAKLKLLRRSFKGLSDEQRNSDIGANLTQQINELDGELKQLDGNIGVFTRNVGNYEGAIISALKRAGGEKALNNRFDALQKETKDLEKQSKELSDVLSNPNAYGKEQTEKAIQDLIKLEKQIQRNEKEAKDLKNALETDTKIGGGNANAGKGDISGRSVKRAGKLAGLGGLGDIAGGAVDLTSILGKLGPAGIAAFGVFAAGGLVFKGIQALEGLTNGINKTTAEVQRLSGASSEEAKQLTDEVRTLSMAFGENEEQVIDNAKAISESLGISFADALGKVKDGYIATATAGGALNSTVKTQLDSSAQLVGVQRELADRFNQTGISTGTLVTDIKTGLLRALITVYDAIKPVIDGFISFGKTIFSVIGLTAQATGASNNFTKIIKAAFVPLRLVGVVISKVAAFLGGLLQKFVDFVNESPAIQAAFKFIGDAVSGFLDFIAAIPDVLSSGLDAIGDFGRDALSAITGGLIDDSATAAAAAAARKQGEEIATALVERYGEKANELSDITKLAIAGAFEQAANEVRAQARKRGKISIFDEVLKLDKDTERKAEEAGKAAADAIAKANGLAVVEAKKATKEQLKSQLEAAEKAKEARQKAADELIEQVKDANEKQREASENFNNTLKSLREKRADESISFIKNDFQRQSAEVEAQTAAQVASVTNAINEVAQAEQQALEAKFKLLANNPNLAKSLGFASQSEITAAAQQSQQAANAEIEAQTAQIQRKRVEQLGKLQADRSNLIDETLRNIDSEATSRALSLQQQEETLNENAISRIQKQTELELQLLDGRAQKASSILAIQRDANIITENEFAQASGEISRVVADTRLKIETNSQRTLLELERKANEERITTLQIQSAQQQTTAQQQAAASIEAIQQQAAQEILTAQQAADAIAQINTDAEATKLAAAELSSQQIEAINTEFANKELTQAQTIANQELLIQQNLQAAIRADREANYEAIREGIEQFNSAIQTSIEISDNLFTASNDKKKGEIAARYADEVARANGNQALITAADKKRDEELQAIEKAAFERKKRLDRKQAFINLALAITNILATTPDPTGIFTGLRIAGAIATTASQIITINAQQFAEGGLLNGSTTNGAGNNTVGGFIPKNGGIVRGRSHKNGGVRANAGGRLVELEGKEAVINKNSTAKYRGLLSLINQDGGGRAFERGGLLSGANFTAAIQTPNFAIPSFALGGLLPNAATNNQAATAQLNFAVFGQAIVEGVQAVALQLDSNMRAITVQLDTAEATRQGNKNISQNNKIRL